MLKSFRLKNIKGFVDTGNIEIKPLTIFIGENSSGKSSILRFPAVLKQTFQPNVTVPLLFNDYLVDYGDFEEIVNQKSKLENIQFKICFDYSNLSPNIEVNSFEIETSLGFNKKKKEVSIENGSFTVNDSIVKYSGDKLIFDNKEFRIAKTQHFLPDEISNIEDNLFTLDSELKTAYIQLDVIVNAINYIGPFRDNPSRVYRYQGKAPTYVGKSGDLAPQILFSLSKSNKKSDKEYLDRISGWLKKILGYNIKVKGISSNLFKLELDEIETGIKNNLVDVGFGISQLLPILVQSFYKHGDENLTIIEQPELHLHPKAQVGLADLFVEAIDAVDNNFFMIETHSEDFLLRLRRYIVEGKLSKDDIVLYYIEKNTETHNCEVRKLEIDDITGKIANWPEGFFSQSYHEVVALEKAAIEKTENSNIDNVVL